MLTPIFIRNKPEWTIDEDGTISLLGKSQTYHVAFVDTLQVQPLSKISLSAVFDQHPAGDHPENMHSEGWLGIGPNGETDPAMTSIIRLRKWLEWTGSPVTVIEIPPVVALQDKVTIFLAVEIGVDNQWPLANLPSTIRDIHVEVTPPTPAPVPVSAPLGIRHVEDKGDFYLVTWKIPKVS
jgi:hypothetical protein